MYKIYYALWLCKKRFSDLFNWTIDHKRYINWSVKNIPLNHLTWPEYCIPYTVHNAYLPSQHVTRHIKLLLYNIYYASTICYYIKHFTQIIQLNTMMNIKIHD